MLMLMHQKLLNDKWKHLVHSYLSSKNSMEKTFKKPHKKGAINIAPFFIHILHLCFI